MAALEIEQYLSEIADPTIADYEANPTSRRYGFVACVMLFHAIDYLQYPDRDGNLRKRLRDESPDFADVDRIAHALRHVSSGNPNDPANQPSNSGEAISRPPAIWGAMVWDLSRWDDATGGVTLHNDREFDLLATLKRAATFIRAQIKAADVPAPGDNDTTFHAASNDEWPEAEA
jgi:nitrogen fixation-related uncharacterized protein